MLSGFVTGHREEIIAMLRGGFTIAQVAHNHGEVCQTITEPTRQRLAFGTMLRDAGVHGGSSPQEAA